ncbi:hypothetical protein E2C01_077471 [Portunus trituberculatus]|uniref:Secreted protein n=1 Tax=Portunus trituberculatus TaxID=210409 RepID=A0A5B7ILH2_PORTR|nr:hypothetical protein [Portunus trituberculatus]
MRVAVVVAMMVVGMVAVVMTGRCVRCGGREGGLVVVLAQIEGYGSSGSIVGGRGNPDPLSTRPSSHLNTAPI